MHSMPSNVIGSKPVLILKAYVDLTKIIETIFFHNSGQLTNLVPELSKYVLIYYLVSVLCFCKISF